MTGNNKLEADLREMIGRGQVVAVVGSGVSVATTSGAPTWRGLIKSGIEQCRTIGAPDAWCELVNSQLKLESHPDMLLSAAELVHQRLRENGGEFRFVSEGDLY